MMSSGHYRQAFENLGKEPGLVGIIFRKAQNKISNPSDLQRVIKMIADEDWSGMDVDIKGAIVDVMQPKPGQVIGPRLRHRRLPPRRPRLHSGQPQSRQSRPHSPQDRSPARHRHRPWRRQPLRHEPLLHGIGSTKDANDPPVDRADIVEFLEIALEEFRAVEDSLAQNASSTIE
ncbi:hypothetical protein AAFN60_18595 [Roseibacillus persicicus]